MFPAEHLPRQPPAQRGTIITQIDAMGSEYEGTLCFFLHWVRPGNIEDLIFGIFQAFYDTFRPLLPGIETKTEIQIRFDGNAPRLQFKVQVHEAS